MWIILTTLPFYHCEGRRRSDSKIIFAVTEGKKCSWKIPKRKRTAVPKSWLRNVPCTVSPAASPAVLLERRSAVTAGTPACAGEAALGERSMKSGVLRAPFPALSVIHWYETTIGASWRGLELKKQAKH